MKREIKFRAKRVDNGNWVEGSLMQFECVTCIMPMQVQDSPLDLIMYEVYHETVGMYYDTDINGVEMFEGTVVKCLDPDGNDTGNTDVIEFNNGCFWLRHRYRSCYDWTNYHARDGEDWNGQFEAIGNIHDNPELLK